MGFVARHNQSRRAKQASSRSERYVDNRMPLVGTSSKTVKTPRGSPFKKFMGLLVHLSYARQVGQRKEGYSFKNTTTTTTTNTTTTKIADPGTSTIRVTPLGRNSPPYNPCRLYNPRYSGSFGFYQLIFLFYFFLVCFATWNIVGEHKRKEGILGIPANFTLDGQTCWKE